VDWVVRGVLARREAGVPLRKQAVLFRAAHHAAALEVELQRRNVPFVKYGGLKFLEAAHVKDALATLRWIENRRDRVAAFRVLQLLPGVGPAAAERALEALADGEFALAALAAHAPPPAARAHWPELVALLDRLDGEAPWAGQLSAVRAWYRPHLERRHDHPDLRAADLEQLEQIAAQFPSRERFLSELTLDPPQATGDLAGPPLVDEDYLVLSTIHSAKGQEWDAVYVLNVVDGCIPSDLATATPDEVEEERRLLYVAMTRARDELDLIAPLRFYVAHQRRLGDRHVYAPRSRFLPDEVVAQFERVAWGDEPPADEAPAARLRARWR
jgi:DNA helicase-2/ATP-dependent DNA helicase PcrA